MYDVAKSDDLVDQWYEWELGLRYRLDWDFEDWMDEWLPEDARWEEAPPLEVRDVKYVEAWIPPKGIAACAARITTLEKPCVHISLPIGVLDLGLIEVVSTCVEF